MGREKSAALDTSAALVLPTNLGACGDGGAVTTNDPAIAAKIRMLSEHGSQGRYIYEEIGINSRLDALKQRFSKLS